MNSRLLAFVFASLVVLCDVAVAQSSLQVNPNLGDMVSNYLTHEAQRDLAMRHEEIAAIRSRSAVRERQGYIERALLRELGGPWPARAPLHAQITGTIDHPDYQVQKLVYQSLPNFYVTADVYVPKHAQKPYPAVLGLAGHSGDGKAFATYQTAWVSLARRGFLVIAIDPVGQGERLEHLDPVTHRSLLATGGTAEHMADGLQTLLTGTNIARYFVWDGMRAVDYLESRDDVDKTRIATAGNSGGGTQSAYIASLDSRVAAAVISCYLTSWKTLWPGPGPQDSEQVFDHFLADHLDFPDFLIGIAPRPAEMEVATRDFFPIAGAHATFAEAKNIFRLLGADERVALYEADDTHGWSKPRRLAMYKWLSQWVQNRSDDGVEAEVKPDSPAALNATPSGQVLTTYSGAETVQSLNAALAEKLRATPAPSESEPLASLVRRRLALPESTTNPAVEKVGAFSRGEVRIEKIEVHPEPGITVPGLVFSVATGPAHKHAILYLNPAGMAVDAVEGGRIEQLAGAGNVVLAIDPRGWGESAPPNRMTSGYRSDYQLAMRAILVGKSMPGMQTYDVLGAFRYLQSRPDVDPDQIALRTFGFASNLGLFAAVLEPRIRTVVCDKPPMSYLAIAQLKLNNVSPEVIIPGVLRDFDVPDLIRALGARVRIGE